MNFNLTSSYQYTELKYDNPAKQIHSKIRTSHYYINVESEQKWSPFYKTSAGYSAGYANGKGQMLRNAESQTQSVYANQTFLIPIYFIRLFDRLSLYPSIRYDHFSEYQDAVTLHGGFVFGRYLDKTTYMLKGSAGNQYRIPTFNERYWDGDGGIGNANIKPERSISMNSGFTIIQDLDHYGTIQSELNAFYNRTHQKIVWESGVIQQGMISPVNLRKSRSAGWEFLTTYAWDSLTCRLSFVKNLSEDISSDQTKRIPYSPLYVFKFSAQWSTERFMFFQSTRYNSERFVTLQNTRYLKPYWITDLTVQYRTSFLESRIFIFANLNNVFDSTYEPVSLYPGPARLFEIGIKIGY
jgi:outer membrane cobalamin receptor